MQEDRTETKHLLDGARRGEPDAVDRLLALHREPLRRMIDFRLDPALAGRLDASDVTQDVLLEASRRLNDYLRNPTMPFHVWLRHLARDHMIDAHRRHRRAQRRSLDKEQPILPAALKDHSSVQLAAQFVDKELTPASAAIRHEMERRLHEALDTLNEDDYEIILMRIFEQIPNQEVAAELGLREEAASMRYLRAVRRLKDVLVPDSPSSS